MNLTYHKSKEDGMSLTYQWAVKRMKEGKSAEEIEKEAEKTIKEQALVVLQRRIQSHLSGIPLWHDTDGLTDEDVISVFTEVGKEAVRLGKHRQGGCVKKNEM